MNNCLFYSSRWIKCCRGRRIAISDVLFNSLGLKLLFVVMFLIGCTIPEESGRMTHYSAVIQSIKKDSFFRQPVRHGLFVCSVGRIVPHRSGDADVIVIAKLSGWTTPLVDNFRTDMESDTVSTGEYLSLPNYNSAVHLVILESLKGPHRPGDTIAYLQFGGLLNDTMRTVGFEWDIFAEGCNEGLYADLKRLVYLRKFGSADEDLDPRINIQRVRFPVYVPSERHYIISGDTVRVGSCPLTEEPGETTIPLDELRQKIANPIN